ncbi:MAG: hypothetical protein L0216_07545 [Planctomycetales bacterium]|nr:hypothetical protein [Planctomycetales bacterium]
MKAVVLLGVVGIALSPHASAVPQQRSKGAPDLTKPEAVAFATVEKEMLRLAAAAVAAKDAAGAERALRLGLDVWPGSTKLKAELERVHKLAAAGKAFPPGPPTAAAREKLVSTAAAAPDACSKALGEAALLLRPDFPERSERLVGIVKTSFPTEEALAKLEPAYFAPYFTWFSKGAAARLEAGDELLDGKWIPADRVADLDSSHSTWENPWVLADETHEVNTTLPLRTAKQILHYIGQFRRHFFSRYGHHWDLRHPGGKLPVYVTQTREELGERLRKTGMGVQQGELGYATYFLSPSPRMPIFACFEIPIGNSDIVRVPTFDFIQIKFTRELTYQLLFEYSKHGANKSRAHLEHQCWSTQAIARYLGFHKYDGLEWRLTRPQELPLPPGQGALDTPFMWCKQNRSKIPPLKWYLALDRKGFEFPSSDDIATLLGWFLIEGEGGKYAPRFYALLQDVIRIEDTPKLFEERFAGVDKAELQKEWERFLETYTLD